MIRSNRSWTIAIAAALAPFAAPAAAQRSLPASCTSVTWPTSGTVYRPSVIYTSPRSLIIDSLLRILPTHSWSVAGSGVEVIEGIRRLWDVDSTVVEQGLAEIITDDREFSPFTANIAAEGYQKVSGRADPLLSVFTEAGEPSSRLSPMLGALRAPVDTLAQAQVFGYACNAAWVLLRLTSDPFLSARAAAGHEVFYAVEEEGILAVAKRLVTGPLHTDMETLLKLTRSKHQP